MRFLKKIAVCILFMSFSTAQSEELCPPAFKQPEFQSESKTQKQNKHPQKSYQGLEPVPESWIFQNFETRDTKNHKYRKFKKSVSMVFSLKRMKIFSKNCFFCVSDRFSRP